MSDAPAPRRRAGWRLLLGTAIGLVVLTVGSVWLWLESDGDLRAARQRIADAGFALTIKDLGLQRSSAERCAQVGQLARLLGGGKLRASALVFDQRTGKPGVAPRSEVLAHHAGLDPLQVAECERLIDGLGDDPFVLDPGSLNGAGSLYQLENYLYERALLAPPEQVAAAVERMLRLIAWNRGATWSHFRLRSSYLPGRVLLYHLKDLRREERMRFAAALRGLLADPAGLMLELQRMTLAVTVPAMSGDMAFARYLKESGMSIPRVLEWQPVRAVVVRAGRAALLDWQLEWALALRAPGAELRGLLALAKARPLPQPDASRWNPSRLLWEVAPMSAHEYLVTMFAERRLFDELVAAVLCDEPWPVDWFDPGAARLRPIVQDGVILGAYSVGADGVDDGGIGGNGGKDRRWALFGPIDPLPPLPTPPSATP